MIIQFKQMNRSLDTETIMQRLNAGADDIVYIGGSLVDGTVNPLSEGMGNESSDVDVFVMGDDWKGQFDFLKDYCEVVYLPRTEGISTTQLKEELKG